MLLDATSKTLTSMSRSEVKIASKSCSRRMRPGYDQWEKNYNENHVVNNKNEIKIEVIKIISNKSTNICVRNTTHIMTTKSKHITFHILDSGWSCFILPRCMQLFSHTYIQIGFMENIHSLRNRRWEMWYFQHPYTAYTTIHDCVYL